MGKTIKRVIALLLSATAVILLLIPAGNVEATYNKGDFVIDGGTLVSYTGNETDLTIPLGITTIGKDCFSKNNNLNSVYIPDEVTSIDYAAFEDCKNLKKVTIGDGLKSIGQSAFSGCQSLSTVNIPRYVESLGSAAFAACPNLSTVTIDPRNRNFICLDGVIYTKDGNKMCQYLAGRPYSTYEIPQPVTEIEEFGFYGANMLTDVTIAQGVLEISDYAFLNCMALNSVKIPNSVKAIRKGAFGGCPNLNSLAVPASVGYIDPDAFTSLSGEKGDVVNATTGEVLSESGSGINDAGRGFETVKSEVGDGADNSLQNQSQNQDGAQQSVPDETDNNTVSEIVSENIDNLVNNVQSALPDGEIDRTTIVGGEAVFLTNPKSFKVYGFDIDGAQTEDSIADSGNSSAVGEDMRSYSGREFDIVGGNFGHYGGNSDSVIIPDGTTKIGNRVFYNNTNLNSVQLPGSVNEIGDFSFARSSLNSVNIPDGTEKIGYAAFYNCNNLADISIPSSVKTIELGALDGTKFVEDWKKIEDGNNYLVVGDGILVASKGYLKDVVIPQGVKQIGPGVFSGNNHINSVLIPDTVTKIGEDAFNGCTKIKNVTLPRGLEIIEDRAFKDTSLTSVEIPPTVEEIGLGAFDTKNVNGGLDAVIFKGGRLPDTKYKPTASRLSAENLRTNAFNGTDYAFIPAGTDVNSGTIFKADTYGFRGQIYSSGDTLSDGSATLQLRKCTKEPDVNGIVSVDSQVSIGNNNYYLSGVSDTAFNEYKDSSWCVNKLTEITLDGNRTADLDSLLSDVNFSAQTGSNVGTGDGSEAISVKSSSLLGNAADVNAILPKGKERFNMSIEEDDGLVTSFNSAFDDRFGNHDSLVMKTLSIDMTDRLDFIPIKKMAKSKLEITMPLPGEFLESENVKVATLDDNGLFEEVASNVIDNGENKEITFVASHLSPFAIYAVALSDDTSELNNSDSAANTKETESVEIITSDSAPIPENIVMGTLTKEVAGIPAKVIVAVILFSASIVLFLQTIKKAKKRT